MTAAATPQQSQPQHPAPVVVVLRAIRELGEPTRCDIRRATRLSDDAITAALLELDESAAVRCPVEQDNASSAARYRVRWSART